MMMTSTNMNPAKQHVLLTGATGYIGGRLLKALEKQGHRVRCLTRRPTTLKAKVGPSTEIVMGDALDQASLEDALQGIEVAYYLIHSMGSNGAFEQLDRQAARSFGQAAKSAGVSRIIYLGGLGNTDEALSKHLRSRHEVGDLLRESSVPVLEFRASIIIGSGSLSFEMIRSLVERLPIMITPKWVKVPAQPIAIDDVLQYLVSALELSTSQSRIYEIGGADIVSYADIMHTYARQRKIHLRMIPVPVLTPYISSLWLGLITPLYARIGRKLIEKEARKYRIALKEISEAELTKVATENGLGRPDDLLAAIGYGKFSARSILARLAPTSAASSTHPPAEPEAPPTTFTSVVRRVFGGDTSAIKVSGHDDMLVFRARCCNPIRGEDIIGYVTRGKGVAVHSKTCKNVVNLMYEPERRIDVEWGKDGSVGTTPAWQTGFPVKLVVLCDNRPGMLNQITAVISGTNTNIRSIGANTEGTHATVEIVADAADVKHLERIVNGVRKIPGVREVQRVQKV